jgi:hypothetical protein
MGYGNMQKELGSGLFVLAAAVVGITSARLTDGIEY